MEEVVTQLTRIADALESIANGMKQNGFPHPNEDVPEPEEEFAYYSGEDEGWVEVPF